MSNDTQGTPALAFTPGEAKFTAPFGHTLHLESAPTTVQLSSVVAPRGAIEHKRMRGCFA